MKCDHEGQYSAVHMNAGPEKHQQAAEERKIHAVASTDPTGSAWCFPKNNLEPFLLNTPMTEAFVPKSQH